MNSLKRLLAALVTFQAGTNCLARHKPRRSFSAKTDNFFRYLLRCPAALCMVSVKAIFTKYTFTMPSFFENRKFLPLFMLPQAAEWR
jgi:hypothetical protein